MSAQDKLQKNLQNALKLSGFIIRREFCAYILEKFEENALDLRDTHTFNTYIKSLCSNLQKQDINERSIEKENVIRAVDVCLDQGLDEHETVFKVINFYDFPHLNYDSERKIYLPALKKPKMLSAADSKAKLFYNRYMTILQRTQRNFKHKMLENNEKAQQISLQTVDFLLTLSHFKLDMTLVLGSILMVSEGKYFLEDPTGIVQLDLTHAKYHGGFFLENSFILVNGYYEDKILKVSTIILPPGEEYTDSRSSFGNINYFGGDSIHPLRSSTKLKEHLAKSPDNMILFFSDLWLDHPMVFEKLDALFSGVSGDPPVAFVFMGNFMSEAHATENMERLRQFMRRFGECAANYPSVVGRSEFIFVPGMSDPSQPHIAPRFGLPNFVIEDLQKSLPNAIFATNPCRIQYCNKEIVVFRADILAKLLQGSMYKPDKEDIPQFLTRTIISQGTLSPLPLNAQPVHWDFDHTLRLYPVPNLVMLGDKSEGYKASYKGCQVANPGSFCDGNFQFKCYYPFTDSVEDCQL